MKFHPILAASTVAIAGALVFGGCGGGSNGPPRPNPTSTPVPGAPTPTPVPGAPTPTPVPGAPTPTPNPTPTPTMAPVSLRGQIGFVSTRLGDSDIFLMDAQGNNQRAFAAINSTGDDRSPGITPSGGRIVWSSNRPNGADTSNFEIYTARADGTNVEAYTNDSGDFAPDDIEPVVSPDGLKIAWTTTRGGNRNIATMDITGGNQVVLTLGNNDLDSEPAWTSDSRSIVFYSARDGQRGIYIMNADGSNQRALLVTPDGSGARYRQPALSPNGQLLAVAFDAGDSSTISLRNLNGTEASTQFDAGSGFEVRRHPSFSPDGSRLIYEAFNDGGTPQIQTSSLNGSGERALTSQGFNFDARFGG